MILSLHAPAKINWFLSVAGKRPDGYHDIRSVMQCVSLCDTLSFEEAKGLKLECTMDIPLKENLVYRSALLLKERTSCRRGAKITLMKEIPVSAGLGGGSSDAATTLIGLNRLWGLKLGKKRLMALASEIGSDIPFFIDGPFAFVEGRGERITSLSGGASVPLLIVKPDAPVSASWAYGAYDQDEAMLTKKIIDIKLFCHSLERKDFFTLRQMVVNDLEKAVVRKHRKIAEVKKMLMRSGAVISSMSGSGSAVFGIFPSDKEALRAAAGMGKHWCTAGRTLV